MSTELVFPAQVILGLVTMSLLAKWFVAPRLAELPRESALQPLLAVHTLRYIGLVFLAPAATGSSLAQSFAVPAGLGTAIAGLLALGSIALLRARSPLAIPLIWIFSVEGIADFRQRVPAGPQRRGRDPVGRCLLHPDRHRPRRPGRTRDDPGPAASPLRLTRRCVCDEVPRWALL